MKKAALMILGCLLVIAAVVWGLRAWEEEEDRRYTAGLEQEPVTSGDPYSDEDEEQVYFDGDWYALRRNMETILLMGVDQYEGETHEQLGYRNSQRADFLTLLVLDHGEKTVQMIQLNRDTMADITILGVRGDEAGSLYGQLALAHTYGKGDKDSCRNMVKAVSEFLYGIKIDHYMALTMDAIGKLNDLVGGVPVTLTEDFTFLDPEFRQGETVTLMGEQALAFVRARMNVGDGTNIQRMERQRQYMESFYTQFKDQSERNENFMLGALEQISEYMTSDCTIYQLSTLYNAMERYEAGEIRTPEGEAVVGNEFMEFYADDEKLADLVVDVFYQKITQ